MTPGSQTGYKVCPQCSLQCSLETSICPRCGHQFRQQFGSPPGNPTFPPNATQMFAPPVGQATIPNPNGFLLSELARRSNDARKTFLITFWVGLFCLWPVWIVTYLEYAKMRSIKDEVGRMGIDVRWWQVTYQARDPF